MSIINTVTNTGSQLTTNYDLTKIFLGANRYRTGSFKNTTGSTLVVPAGTLLAKVQAIAVDTANVVGYLRLFDSTNTEGGKIAVGILNQDLSIAAGSTVTNVNYCVAGDFDNSKLIFQGSDTLDTVVAGKAIREIITAETTLIGISSTQMSGYDNQ